MVVIGFPRSSAQGEAPSLLSSLVGKSVFVCLLFVFKAKVKGRGGRGPVSRGENSQEAAQWQSGKLGRKRNNSLSALRTAPLSAK